MASVYKSETYELETRSLSIGYQAGDALFKDIDLQIQDGQLICILGPNGIGKSTLIKTVAGLLTPLRGKVMIAGLELSTLSPAVKARHLSLVLTNERVHGGFDVFEMVALGRFPYTNWLGHLSELDRQVIQNALHNTGIEHLANKKIHDISDGERQKAMIARALVQDTNLMLLDEPTAYLDIRNRNEVMKLLKRLSEKHTKTILLSTHEVPLAMKYADRLILMGEETTIFNVSPQEARRDHLLEKLFGLEY